MPISGYWSLGGRHFVGILREGAKGQWGRSSGWGEGRRTESETPTQSRGIPSQAADSMVTLEQ